MIFSSPNAALLWSNARGGKACRAPRRFAVKAKICAPSAI
jgi:hypothetical protein